MANSKELETTSLPPTQKTTYFHSLRVYLEIIKAIKLNIDFGLNPCHWGWKRSKDVLKIIKTNLPPAPDFLLCIICFKCKPPRRTRRPFHERHAIARARAKVFRRVINCTCK